MTQYSLKNCFCLHWGAERRRHVPLPNTHTANDEVPCSGASSQALSRDEDINQVLPCVTPPRPSPRSSTTYHQRTAPPQDRRLVTPPTVCSRKIHSDSISETASGGQKVCVTHTQSHSHTRSLSRARSLVEDIIADCILFIIYSLLRVCLHPFSWKHLH